MKAILVLFVAFFSGYSYAEVDPCNYEEYIKDFVEDGLARSITHHELVSLHVNGGGITNCNGELYSTILYTFDARNDRGDVYRYLGHHNFHEKEGKCQLFRCGDGSLTGFSSAKRVEID